MSLCQVTEYENQLSSCYITYCNLNMNYLTAKFHMEEGSVTLAHIINDKEETFFADDCGNFYVGNISNVFIMGTYMEQQYLTHNNQMAEEYRVTITDSQQQLVQQYISWHDDIENFLQNGYLPAMQSGSKDCWKAFKRWV